MPNGVPDNTKRLEEELEQQIAQKGAVTVLRQGITFGEVLLPGSVPLPFLGPQNKKNIVRARWRAKDESETEAPDLALLINGIPVAAVVLRMDKSQTIDDAMAAYEPLKESLKDSPFVVYFAISRDEVRMTTSLSAPRFFPFNQGFQGHAGNPPVAKDSDDFPTSYFFTQVCQKKNWIRIFQHFIFEDHKGVTIFPRYHQWDAVAKLMEALQTDKVGKSYLIEHSAGSGKTNTIAWLAHALRDMVDPHSQKPTFSSVILVTNRVALDQNLKRALRQIHRADLVEIGMDDDTSLTSLQSKSQQLARALTVGNNIIIVTVQTFQYCLGYMQRQSDTNFKKYALIIDEAHSLDCGEYIQSLRRLLNPAKAKTQQQIREELAEKGELDAAEYSRYRQDLKKKPKNVSSFAFTATPKPRTQDNYGTEELDAAGNRIRGSFHLYPMCQAVEEGFILYPLKGYVSGGTALMKLSGIDLEDRMVDSLHARRKLAQWRELHPVNILEKTRRILEHCAEHVAPLLDGQAKIMVITASRAAVARYKVAIEDYLERHPDLARKIMPEYPQKGAVLAAFSNSLTDEDWRHPEDDRCDPNPFARLNSYGLCTEATLNNLEGQSIEKLFERPENRLLVVAEKFQVGFDQPKLCALYVDRKIKEPLNIVQTYSRVNRTMEGKDQLFIVDFHNDLTTVREAFGQYRFGLGVRSLEESTDMNLVKKQLDESGFYTPEDFELFKKGEYMWVEAKEFKSRKATTLRDANDLSAPRVVPRLADVWMRDYQLQRKKLLTSRKVLGTLEGRYQKDPTALEDAAFREQIIQSEDYEVQEEESRLQLGRLCDFRANLYTFHHAYQDLVAVTDFDPEWEAFDEFAKRLYDRLFVAQETIDLTGLTLHDYKIRIVRQGLKRAKASSGASHDRPAPPSFKSLHNVVEQVSDEGEPSSSMGLVAVKADLDSSRLYTTEDVLSFGQLFQKAKNRAQELAQRGRFAAVGESLETHLQRLFFALNPIVNRWRMRSQETPTPLFFTAMDEERGSTDPSEFKRNLEDFRRMYAEAYYSENAAEKREAQENFANFYAFVVLLLTRLNDKLFKNVAWNELQVPSKKYVLENSVAVDQKTIKEGPSNPPVPKGEEGKNPQSVSKKSANVDTKLSTLSWSEMKKIKTRMDACGLYTKDDLVNFQNGEGTAVLGKIIATLKKLDREQKEIRIRLLSSLDENLEEVDALVQAYKEQTAALKVLDSTIKKFRDEPLSIDPKMVPWQKLMKALSRNKIVQKYLQVQNDVTGATPRPLSTKSLFPKMLKALRAE